MIAQSRLRIVWRAELAERQAAMTSANATRAEASSARAIAYCETKPIFQEPRVTLFSHLARRSSCSDKELSNESRRQRWKIRTALEAAGIEFIDENGSGPGVRLRFPHAASRTGRRSLCLLVLRRRRCWRRSAVSAILLGGVIRLLGS